MNYHFCSDKLCLYCNDFFHTNNLPTSEENGDVLNKSALLFSKKKCGRTLSQLVETAAAPYLEESENQGLYLLIYQIRTIYDQYLLKAYNIPLTTYFGRQTKELIYIIF